jgi:hypothetical protein
VATLNVGMRTVEIPIVQRMANRAGLVAMVARAVYLEVAALNDMDLAAEVGAMHRMVTLAAPVDIQDFPSDILALAVDLDGMVTTGGFMNRNREGS